MAAQDFNLARKELEDNLLYLLEDYNKLLIEKPERKREYMPVFLGQLSFLSGQLCAYGGRTWEDISSQPEDGVSVPQKIANIATGPLNLLRQGIDLKTIRYLMRTPGVQEFPQIIAQFRAYNADILAGFTNMAKAGWQYASFTKSVYDRTCLPPAGKRMRTKKGGNGKRKSRGDEEEEEEEEEGGALKDIMINMITTSIMLGMGVAAIKSGAALVALRGIDYCYRLGKSMLFSLGYLKDPCTTDFQIIAGLIMKSMPGIGQHYQSCGDIARRNEAMTLALRGTMGTIYTAAVAMGLKTIGWRRTVAILPNTFSTIKEYVAEPLYNKLETAGTASKNVTIRVFTGIAANGSLAAQNGANKILGLFQQASCGLGSFSDDKRVADVAATVSAVTAAKDVSDEMDRMERGVVVPEPEQREVVADVENVDEGNTADDRADKAQDPTAEIQIMIDQIQDAGTKEQIKAAVNTFMLRTNADLALKKMNEEQSKIANAETSQDRATAKKAIKDLYESMDKPAQRALDEKLSEDLKRIIAEEDEDGEADEDGEEEEEEEDGSDGDGDGDSDSDDDDEQGGGRRKNKRRPRKTKRHMRKKKKTRRRKTKGRKGKTKTRGKGKGKGKSKSGTIKRKPKSKTRKGKRKAKRSTRKYKR